MNEMIEKTGDKKAPAIKFKKVMDEKFAEIVKRFARNYFFFTVGNVSTIIWDEDDLVQELTLVFLKDIAKGTVPEHVSRDHLRWRTLDAIRNLEKNKGLRRYRYLGTNPETGEKIREGLAFRVCEDSSIFYTRPNYLGNDWNAVDILRASGTRRVKEVSISELAEEIQEPTNPAEELRRRFENEGSLWTSKFHEDIEAYLNQLVEERARKFSHARVRGQHTIDRVEKWVRDNPDANPTHSCLSLEIQSERETVTRCLSKLVKKGVIAQTPVTLENKGDTERTRGRNSYHIV